MELPSQLIGIELCSTSMSSAYTREQWPTLCCIGPTVHPITTPRLVSEQLLSPSNRVRARTLQPSHEKPSTARCTAVVSIVAGTAAGTTTLLVDAPRTCRRPRALLRGPASKSSGQTRPYREIARAPTTSTRPVPPIHKKRDVIGFPLLPLHGRLVICYHLV